MLLSPFGQSGAIDKEEPTGQFNLTQGPFPLAMLKEIQLVTNTSFAAESHIKVHAAVCNDDVRNCKFGLYAHVRCRMSA